MGSSASINVQEEKVREWDSITLSSKLQESGLQELSKVFRTTGITGEVLLLLARIFLDSSYAEEAGDEAAGGSSTSEAAKLKAWVGIIITGSDRDDDHRPRAKSDGPVRPAAPALPLSVAGRGGGGGGGGGGDGGGGKGGFSSASVARRPSHGGGAPEAAFSPVREGAAGEEEEEEEEEDGEEGEEEEEGQTKEMCRSVAVRPGDDGGGGTAEAPGGSLRVNLLKEEERRRAQEGAAAAAAAAEARRGGGGGSGGSGGDGPGAGLPPALPATPVSAREGVAGGPAPAGGEEEGHYGRQASSVSTVAGKDGLMFQPGEAIPPSAITVVRYLASGNYGEVYEAAEDVGPGKPPIKLAMKVVRFANMAQERDSEGGGSSTLQAKKNDQLVELCQETRLALGLSHPRAHQNLVAVRYASICEKTILDRTLRVTVLFVDYAEGRELEDLIAARAREGAPPPPPSAAAAAAAAPSVPPLGPPPGGARWRLYEASAVEDPQAVAGRLLGAALQVARGLAHCHALAVLHQDIKPANIMVQTNGVVKLSDFGLSCRGTLEEEEEEEMNEDKGKKEWGGGGAGRRRRRTARAVFKGCTPAYRSPEIAGLLDRLAAKNRDKSAWSKEREKHKLEPRTSDIWAFGLVLLEMFSVGRPWPGYGENALEGLQKYNEKIPDAHTWGAREVEAFFARHKLGAVGRKARERALPGSYLVTTSRASLKSMCGKAGVAARAWKAMGNLERFPMPPQVRKLLSQIFSPNPAHRPSSMDDIVQELEAISATTVPPEANKPLCLEGQPFVLAHAFLHAPPPVSAASAAATLGNLGQVLRHYGAAEQALGCYQEAEAARAAAAAAAGAQGGGGGGAGGGGATGGGGGGGGVGGASGDWGKAEDLMEMGAILREEGRLEESREALARALALRPGHANTLYSLAATEELRGDLGAAVGHHRAAAAALEAGEGGGGGGGGGPVDDEARALLVDVLNDLAIDLADLGRPGEAAPVLRRAAALDPGDPMKRYQLGKALLELAEGKGPEGGGGGGGGEEGEAGGLEGAAAAFREARRLFERGGDAEGARVAGEYAGECEGKLRKLRRRRDLGAAS